ncbi:hypothetical protein K503DRAFT_770393 [Rhizopogon vinicolor AM-OR11-026]|uniref:Uncharacterized protein n=1 Tax=Rhizopogon vinicolor AM-OR11-026 TaxID=1314800 RepID=A0A1B7N119_9AGAM|nr:hypothetical protein K503DRAFT_770393 [Rhizopogon vinicolor AM-OR11-026]
MKFISLAAIIMPVALAGIATAVDPNGGPCKDANMYECGTLTGYNSGDPFLFYCSADSATNRVEVIKECTCDTCCSVVKGGVGDGGHVSCT